MIVASDVYKKYCDDIKFDIAKTKLVTGNEDLSKCGFLVLKRALNLFGNTKEVFIYHDDISRGDNYQEVKDLLKSSGVLFIYTYIGLGGSSKSCCNIDKFDTSIISSKECITIEDSPELNEVVFTDSSSIYRLYLHDLENLTRLSYGREYHDLSKYKSFISIDDIENTTITNCCNNSHYNYVYLRLRSLTFDRIRDSFNNCTIDNLILNVDKWSTVNLSSCFKFTSADNINIKSNNYEVPLRIKHLVNRLKFMRGRKYV